MDPQCSPLREELRPDDHESADRERSERCQQASCGPARDEAETDQPDEITPQLSVAHDRLRSAVGLPQTERSPSRPAFLQIARTTVITARATIGPAFVGAGRLPPMSCEGRPSCWRISSQRVDTPRCRASAFLETHGSNLLGAGTG